MRTGQFALVKIIHKELLYRFNFISERITIMTDIKHQIIEKIGIISDNENGWRKELNLISWNGKPPKYDIRDWSADHSKMSKGITLSTDEVKALIEALGWLEL